MKKITLLQRAMVINRVFTYAVLERHTELSQSFIFTKVKAYEKAGFIVRAGMDGRQKQWRLTLEGKRQFDPNFPKEPIVNSVSRGNRPAKPLKIRPEYRMWKAMWELKIFTSLELQELNLANTWFTSMYISMLIKAGILSVQVDRSKKLKKYEGRYKKTYSLTKKAGAETPIIGKVTYIWDPNSGEYFATEMKKFETKNRPGDGDAS